MNRPTVCCVVTTIHDFAFVVDFARTRASENCANVDVTFMVIVDRKTSPLLEASIQRARSLGLDVEWPSLSSQEAFLRKLGLGDLVPFNSDNRRNIGFLMAYAQACDVLISLDDDNRPVPTAPFFGAHLSALTDAAPGRRVTTPSSWFNVCECLEVEPGMTIFPRGFPYSKRSTSCEEVLVEESEAAVGTNVGLWIGDPDVDAVTRLALRPRAVSVRRSAVYLSASTWTPMNTQNTSLLRELIPAYYYLWMGDMGNGKKVDRFGDIWSGYFLQAVMKHLNYASRVGTPIVEHVRTTHDLIQDLSYEVPGIELTEGLVDWVVSAKLSGSTPTAAYESLSHALDDEAERFSGWAWDRHARSYMHKLASKMRLWLSGIRQIAG
jgi:hypothetical protein